MLCAACYLCDRAYVSIRQHTLAHVSVPQHDLLEPKPHTMLCAACYLCDRARGARMR